MKIQLLVFLICSIFLLDGHGQPGAIDPTFNPTDIGFNNGEGADNLVYTSAIQNDGKIIIGGLFASYNGISIKGLARLNADGTLDAGFNTGAGINGYVKSILLQSDGKIIIGGFFNNYNGTSVNNIARINSDGTMDASFSTGTGTNAIIESMFLQSDGKVLIGGNFTNYNGTSRTRIARINNDGSIDTGFNPGTGADDRVFSFAVKTDGKILIGGDFTTFSGTSIKSLAQLNSNGSLDATFNTGSGPDNRVNSIVLQPDGKIIIAGWFLLYNGTNRAYIARLNSDGTLDAGFNSATGANSVIYGVSLQNDGKIVIAGDFTSYKFTSRTRMAKLNSDGTLDSGFLPATGANAKILSLNMLSDGKFIITGSLTSYNNLFTNFVACVNTDGSVDPNFNLYTGLKGEVDKTVIQSDGKILIAGYFNVYNGNFRSNIARVNFDGSIDNSFNPGKGTDDQIMALALQSDGKIIIGGRFTLFNGNPINMLARLNSDGTIDSGFNIGTGPDNYVWSLAIQSDGKILVGGTFTSYNGTAANNIVRLNNDGSLDATFTGTGTNNSVEAIAIQSDGKIIIGGSFTSYNGTTKNRVLRLNTDGTIDSGFNIGTGCSGSVYAIAVQSDGKIVVGGTFTTYNGVSRKNINRINSNGSIDATFSPGTGTNNQVNAISIQSDGKIIISGTFTSFNGTGRNRIARLTTNGALDAGFTPGTGAASDVYCANIQPDGRIIIAGRFTSYDGTGRHRITRLKGDVRIQTTVTSTSFCKGNSVTVNFTVISGPLNAGNIFTAQLSSSSGSFVSPTAIGTLNATIDGTISATIPLGSANGSSYRIRVASDNSVAIGTDNGTNITINPLPSVSINPFSDICESAAPLSLFLGTPYGGVYSGTGVSGTTFDPGVATAGTFPITYSYTDVNGCTNSAFENINVLPKPSVSLSAFSPMCKDASVITLSGGVPASGTYSVDGTTATSFDPGSASTGNHTVSYFVTGSNGCTNTANTILQVNALPVVSLSSFSSVCINTPSFALVGGYPTSGIYSGTGVNAGNFDAAVATAGTYLITYSYTDANGCFGSASKNIKVNPLPTANLTAFANVCNSSSEVTLTGGSPNGGNYTGTNVSSGKFNPISSGTFPITYSYTDGNSCTNIATASITVTVCTESLSETEMDKISLFPNPSEGMVTISVPSQGYSAELYNTQGSLIYNYDLNELENRLNFSELPKGLYSLKLRYGENVKIIKLMLK